uniref:RING-type E3 ubiquitin transferase n=1 Tax=Glossina brevipalpis TaxID=37001 RepID=A0A1A9X271_9MUSC
MAEAVVEERNTMPGRFYCHICNVEISAPIVGFTCPLCTEGFIEELPPPERNVSNNDVDNGNTEEFLPLTRNVLINGLPSLGSGDRPNLQISIEAVATLVNNRGNLVTVIGSIGNNRNNDRRVRPRTLYRLDNTFSNSLLNVFGEVEVQTPTGSRMAFMGNLGDGLDAVVAQFLNQMGHSRTSPLSRDKIDEIPKFLITDDVVDKQQQCSVCLEYFKLEELVRKLPCSHLFHDDCIVPWLSLHGNCPTCRKSLNVHDEESNAGIMDTTSNSDVRNNDINESSSG